jgi:hypothetical protein
MAEAQIVSSHSFGIIGEMVTLTGIKVLPFFGVDVPFFVASARGRGGGNGKLKMENGRISQP